MAAGVVIASIVVILTLVLWITEKSKVKRVTDKIPGPPALPLIGNAHQFKVGGSDFFEQVMNYCRDYDKDRMLRLWIGPYPAIALYKPETVEVVLRSTKHMTKSREYDYLQPWLGTGLLTSTGAKWKVRRKMLTPTFHFRILTDFLQVFNEQAEIMVKRLEGQLDQPTFDVFPYITLCALDIICDTAMGRHVNAQAFCQSDYVKAVYKLSTLVHRRQKTPWLWPDFLYSKISPGRDTRQCLQIVHGFTQKVIRERKAEFEAQLAESDKKNVTLDSIDEDKPLNIGSRKRLAFLDMLLYASQGDDPLSDEDIREEVDTFMFEGHDTTAAATNWAVHFIGANPDVQKKMHEELDDVFGDEHRPVTMDDLKKLKYMECVIKEALRLCPSVPMFARTLSEDCKIGGYDVLKGTTAIVVTTALHRDPDHFPDPETFDPSRWESHRSAGRHPYCYVPFSAGMRNCIGQKFAMNEEKVLLTYILRNFNVTSRQKREDLRPVGELILRPEDGILVELTARKK